MRHLRLALLASFVAATVNVAVAQSPDPGTLPTFFPMRAAIVGDPPGGLSRLRLTADVRAQCQPDFSDLRLLGPQGREVPFLVDVADDPTIPSSQSVDATVVEAFREERRRDDAPPLRRESFVLETPEHFDTSGPWSLAVDTAPRDFVRRVEVRQGQQTDEAVPLVEGRSIFRLAGGSRVRTSVELPGLKPGRFVVTLEGEDDTYLSPRFRFERRSEGTETAREDVPLVEQTRRQEPGTTILVLARPPGIVPERIRFDTTTPTFARSVIVRDVLATGRTVVIGEGTIRRRDAADAEPELEVAVRPAQGERIEIAMLDQDSPPLDEVGTIAVMREVALVFSLPAADAGATTLFFGGGRTRSPRYDIAALAKLLVGEASGARLVEARQNPVFDDRPLLGFAMRPGAALDPRVFTYRRSISIPASRTGLARVRLDVADLVAARPDLGDLRILDGDGRQWPYLLERDALITSVSLATTRTEPKGRQTRYTLVPRWQPLRLDGIEIEVDAGFVDRPFQLAARDTMGVEHALVGGRLRRAAGVSDPLRVTFADTRVTELALDVDNGDEAPLSVTAARALCPVSELYVAAPPGDYSLLAGDPETPAPQYEIAGLRPTVLAVPAVDATTEPGGPNPVFSRSATTARNIADGRVLPRLAVWVVLVLAVLVLTMLTLRLVRGGDSR